MRNNINKIRFEKNMTIQNIADATGLSVQTIFRIISGGYPSEKSMKLISSALGLNAEEVFFI